MSAQEKELTVLERYDIAYNNWREAADCEFAMRKMLRLAEDEVRKENAARDREKS